jgi:uncharacterized protein (TIGR02246 family)
VTQSSDADLLRELADIEAIKQLKARYFRTFDHKDWPAFAEVFALEASVDVPEIGLQQTGREQIVATLSAMGDAVRTVHHGHMPEIERTGPDTASGIWAMSDVVEFDGPDGASGGWTGHGHYHETYVREDGAWRIASMRLDRLRVDPR